MEVILNYKKKILKGFLFLILINIIHIYASICICIIDLKLRNFRQTLLSFSLIFRIAVLLAFIFTWLLYLSDSLILSTIKFNETKEKLKEKSKELLRSLYKCKAHYYFLPSLCWKKKRKKKNVKQLLDIFHLRFPSSCVNPC